ncbi:MAG TPA: biopolymer transporter ExbD [Saprospiraceae bacterium]|mgnify:CR=1 FL=1|jgi:biopolymer transport protein ExbD|nr:biopolymer transporter ExbD [Saprospiraceae bacterium]HPI08444.1 biopolymer transporter ExbD [Saprospiraceae bacterium]
MALKRRNRVEPEFSLAAMIDVIFLLLMFFMLTSNMVTPNALNLQLPSSTSKTLASPALSVSVRKEGTYYIEKTAVTEANLENSLRARLRAMGEDPAKTVITVNAEVGAPIEYVVTILDIANRLKLKTILATNPKADTN